MEYLPVALIALACPIGMGLMMLFMGKGMMGMGRSHDKAQATPGDTPPDPDKQLALLEAQRQLLDAQIAAREQSGGGESQPIDADSLRGS